MSGTFPLLLGNDTLNAAWNHGFPFWLYGSFGIIAAFMVLRYVPETRGVDSEQLIGAVAARRRSSAAARLSPTIQPTAAPELEFRGIALRRFGRRRLRLRARLAPGSGPGAAGRPACACC